MTRTKLPWRMRIAIALLALLGACSAALVVMLAATFAANPAEPATLTPVLIAAFLAHSLASLGAAWLLATRPVPGVILGTSVGACSALVLVPLTACVSLAPLEDPSSAPAALLLVGIFLLHAAAAGACLASWHRCQEIAIERMRMRKARPVTF